MHYLWKQESPSVLLPLIAGYLHAREKEGRMCDQFSDSHGAERERERERERELELKAAFVRDNNTLRLMVGSIWERTGTIVHTGRGGRLAGKSGLDNSASKASSS